MDMSRVSSAITIMALWQNDDGCQPPSHVFRWAVNTLVEFMGSNRETPDWTEEKWQQWLTEEVNWNVFNDEQKFAEACYGFTGHHTFLSYMIDMLIRASTIKVHASLCA